MPGYIIHLSVANKFLEIYDKNLSEKNKSEFLLGCVAPDILLKENIDKQEAHFAGEYNFISCAPDIEKFNNKYENELENFFVKGYFTHLYTDYCFYTKYLKEMLEYVEESIVYEDSTQRFKNNKFLIKQTSEIKPASWIFSREGIYDEYNISNPTLIEKYNINLNLDNVDNIKMEEIDMQKLQQVNERLSKCIKTYGTATELKIMSYDSLNNFIENTAIELNKYFRKKESNKMGEKHILITRDIR